MTYKQYEEFRNKNLKIYKIFINKNKIKQEEIEIKKFDQKWIYRQWLNSALPYNTEIKDYFMYVTEDKLQEMKEYFIKRLIKQEEDKMKTIIKRIKKLKGVKL